MVMINLIVVEVLLDNFRFLDRTSSFLASFRLSNSPSFACPITLGVFLDEERGKIGVTANIILLSYFLEVLCDILVDVRLF